MRDSTLRCWRGVQNPAVLRSADHCDEQRVGPIGTFTLRTRCARGGLADRGCTISSAGGTRRGHSQRQQRNQNRIGSTGYHAVCSGAEVEPTARDTRSPTQPRSTPTSPRCAARSSSTHRRRRRNLRPHLPATNPLPQRHLRPRRAPPRRPIRTAPRIRSSRTPRNRSPGRQHLAVKYTV